MNEPRSLTADLRALQAARKSEATVVSAMITMAETMKRIETEQQGLSQSVNLSLGQSREAVNQVVALLDRIAKLETDLAAAIERIEKSSTWAAKLGAWAKEQGMK